MIIRNLISSKLFSRQINRQIINFNYFNFAKIIHLKLGDLGEGTKEATIKQWYKKEGDSIDEEEKVVEVYTDKLVAEIPSPAKGKISKLNYKVEESCLVGKSLCEILIEEEGSAADKPEHAGKKETENKPCGMKSERPGSSFANEKASLEDNENFEELDDTKILATPATRHLIKSHKLNPKLIKPSGKNNRIMKGDVLNYMESLKNKSPEEVIYSKETPKEAPRAAAPQAQATQSAVGSEDKVVKIIGFQKAMTKTMTQATLISSFLFTDEFNVDKLVKIRKEINSTPGNKVKITYTPFFIKAISLALNDFPILNSLVNPKTGEDGYIYEYTVRADHNISVAIDGPEGLVVPNIKRVQDKSVLQIQKELNSLKEKADARRLTSDDLTNGTFTVSNIGNIGGKVLSPVIMPPQSCIIGISKFFDSVTVIPKNPEVLNDSQAYCNVEGKDLSVIIHKTVNICISADHRIIDGATVARFSQNLKNYVENPLKLLMI